MVTAQGDDWWRCLRGGLTAIRGTLTCALVLVFLDVVLDGGYISSVVVCPIWFFIGAIRAVTAAPRLPVAAALVLVPLATGLLVAANYGVQRRIAMANADQIIQACERCRVANGIFPERLGDLVPRYLSSVPIAKYCCLYNGFSYYSSAGGHTLYWYAVPPFGRMVYNFETGEWRYID